MVHKLTKHYQYNKKCKDGKSRSFILYFLNDDLLFKQKLPYDENWEKGFDHRTSIYDEYILNGKIHQTRTVGWRCGSKNDNLKTRQVSFPLSKRKLTEQYVLPDVKIQIECK